MKWSTINSIFALLALVDAMPSIDKKAVAAAPSANGLNFTIDGVTKYFAGTNSYWISFLTNNADVDLTMSHVASSGLKILRIWGFNDVNGGGSGVYFQSHSSSGSTINTGANGLQRLDVVVAAAEKYSVKLIINFVNFWDDYGGMNTYVKAYGGSKTGWYTNSKAQSAYQAYIKAIVTRYKMSSAIFAWELANEPRCPGCSTDVIYNWADTTSKYIKSLDADHMITLGDEGMGVPGSSAYPYGTSEGTDFVKNLKVKNLDFGTYHWYPGSWGMANTDTAAWIKAHADACVAAGKPCLFEEYGVANNHCSIEKPWQAASRSTKGNAGDLFWQWGDKLSTGQTHNDGNTIYVGTSDFQCLVTDHVKAIG